MKTIKQKHFISASPEEVYLALINPLTIELWSGYTAEMQAEEGTEFSIFDGDICGRNISMIENKQLIQEWYFGDSTEESVVTINLKAYEKGTQVELEHINVPDEVCQDIEEGWRLYYWGAIKSYFRK